MKHNNIQIFFSAIILSVFFMTTKLNAQDSNADDSDAAVVPAYNGMTLQFNDQWSLKFSGQLNAFLTVNSVAEDKDNSQDSYTANNISNGLLPTSLIVNPTYKVNDKTTITGTFGLWFGLPSNGLNNDGFNKALQQSTVDIRQLFFTVSSGFGAIDIGRNFGLFGLDAILNDISLLGVGANYSLINPAHTSLGGIGYGYIYVDRLNQINYTTPVFGGTSLTFGLYDEINETLADNKASGEKGLGYHLKLATTQNFTDNVSLYASLAYISQRRVSIDDNINAFDVFAKLSISSFSLTGYYYKGSGIGDVGFLIGGTKTEGTKTVATDSDGYYVQGAYTFSSKTPVILGLNYGASNIEGVDDPSTRITGSLAAVVHSNLILRTEITQQSRQNSLGNSPEALVFALGATFAF